MTIELATWVTITNVLANCAIAGVLVLLAWMLWYLWRHRHD